MCVCVCVWRSLKVKINIEAAFRGHCYKSVLYETGSQGNVFPGIALQFLNGILLGVGFRFLDHPPPHCHGVVLVCTCIFVIKLVCVCVSGINGTLTISSC